MTCVVGLRRNDKVWIGADTPGINSDGWNGVLHLKTSKTWKLGPFVFGSSGSYRAIQLVHRMFDWQNLLLSQQPIDEAFMVKRFVPALKDLFEKQGFSEKDKEVSSQGAAFLIGIHDKLFILQGDYAILDVENAFTSIGSGEYVAIGALKILTQNTRLSPEAIIHRALLTAQKHIATIGPPGDVIHT